MCHIKGGAMLLLGLYSTSLFNDGKGGEEWAYDKCAQESMYVYEYQFPLVLMFVIIKKGEIVDSKSYIMILVITNNVDNNYIWNSHLLNIYVICQIHT